MGQNIRTDSIYSIFLFVTFRHGFDYQSKPYLGQGHPATMSVETQEPIVSRAFGNHGNRSLNEASDSTYSQSDFLLQQAQQTFSHASGFNFFQNFSSPNISSCLGESPRDANQNNRAKLLNESSHIESSKSTNLGSSTQITSFSQPSDERLDNLPLSSHFDRKPSFGPDSSDRVTSHSPTASTGSLSDSEVPDQQHTPTVGNQGSGQQELTSPNKDSFSGFNQNRSGKEEQRSGEELEEEKQGQSEQEVTNSGENREAIRDEADCKSTENL